MPSYDTILANKRVIFSFQCYNCSNKLVECLHIMPNSFIVCMCLCLSVQLSACSFICLFVLSIHTSGQWRMYPLARVTGGQKEGQLSIKAWATFKWRARRNRDMKVTYLVTRTERKPHKSNDDDPMTLWRALRRSEASGSGLSHWRRYPLTKTN